MATSLKETANWPLSIRV